MSPKVYLINPRAPEHRRRASRSSWDRGAVRRVLNASGAWDLLGKGGDMAHHHHHRKRNPIEGGNLLWTVGGAAGGFLLTGSIVSMVLPSVSGIMNYGAQAVVAFGGGWLASKLNRSAGFGFVVGGLASLALQMYKDYTSASASASPGTSFYYGASFPVPYSTGPGNPWQQAAFGPAYPGGTSTLPVGTTPAAAAATGARGGNYSSRLRGRFSN